MSRRPGGSVEFLAETSHHSLAFLADPAEFARQVRSHARRVEALFGRRPTTFRNTELAVDRRVAKAARHLDAAPTFWMNLLREIEV